MRRPKLEPPRYSSYYDRTNYDHTEKFAMRTYRGSCHCGAIRFSFEHDDVIKEGGRCNCSICKRKGAVMSKFTLKPEHIHIEANDTLLGSYRFGSQVANHFFCKTCGIYPFHTTLRAPGEYRVNLGCIDDIDIFNLDVSVFDGKSLPD